MINQNELLQNRYRLIRLLGSGGFGAVYLAEDQRLGRTVAIKEIDVGRLGAAERAAAEQLFEHEARMLASLDHPGLTRIWDVFQQDRRAFLVMEYVPGATLRETLQQRGGPLDEPFVLECALQLCLVLGYLHARRPQVIFRDLKPANVMVVPGDGRWGMEDGGMAPASQLPSPTLHPPSPQIRLIDFGIARLFKPDQTGDTLIIGTPGYAPPEQYGQGQTDERSDIYSLGATLYNLLSGQVPNTVPPPALASVNPAVSLDLARIVARATAVDPADRYQRVEDLRQDLLTAARAQPIAANVGSAPSQTAWPTPVAAHRTPTQLPLPPPALARPARRSSWGVLMVVVLAVLGILGLSGVLLSAFSRQSAASRPTATPISQPTVAAAAQDWLLPDAPGRIAFGQSTDQTGYNILVAALDGSRPRAITNDSASISPAFSPDGTRLAITRGPNANRGIFVATLDRLNFEQVSPIGQEARYPVWSPDGRQIAFALRADSSQPWQIAIIQLSSGAVRTIGQNGIAWISWSSRGALAYSGLDGDSSQQDIFVLEPGGTPRNITNSPGIEEDFPAWSPRGDQIAFVASPAGTANLPQRQIFTMHADGGNRTQLTAGPGPHTNPVWSPDGAWLAYLAQETSPDWQVWAMRADGTAPRQISSSDGRKFYLAWGA